MDRRVGGRPQISNDEGKLVLATCAGVSRIKHLSVYDGGHYPVFPMGPVATLNALIKDRDLAPPQYRHPQDDQEYRLIEGEAGDNQERVENACRILIEEERLMF